MSRSAKDHFDGAAEGAVWWERATLGVLLEAPENWEQVANLTGEDFLLDDHRKIFAAISELHRQGRQFDMISVAAHLGETVEVSYLASLVDGVVPQHCKSYVRGVQESARDRQFQRLQARLGEVKTTQDRLALLEQLQTLLQRTTAVENWLDLFHSYEEFENAPPLQFAIDNFLQEAGITVIGGLSGHGKTLVMLSMARSMLDGVPLFEHDLFAVKSPAERVLYLVPESSIVPFWKRIQLFQLQEHVRRGRLLVRTLSSREQVSLDDVRVLKAAEGSHVFLDTAVRFMVGSENDVENTRSFADSLFRLLAAGARTIVGAHHSPKTFEGQDFMSLENLLRGSSDLGAMVCTAWGVRQVDADNNQLFVQNVKPRDFQPPGPFLLEGRPHLDSTGQFKMLAEPGTARTLRSYLKDMRDREKNDEDGSCNRGGRPSMPGKKDKMRQAAELRAKGESLRQIAMTLQISKSSVERLLFDYDAPQKPRQFKDSSAGTRPGDDVKNSRPGPGGFEVSQYSPDTEGF